jgi:hypothetical protein
MGLTGQCDGGLQSFWSLEPYGSRVGLVAGRGSVSGRQISEEHGPCRDFMETAIENSLERMHVGRAMKFGSVKLTRY